MYVYKKITLSNNQDENITFLEDQFFPLLTEYWSKRGKEVIGKPIDFDSFSFLQSWLYNNLLVIGAYDGTQLVGILFGGNFRPLWYNCNILQLDTCYSKYPEAEIGMLKYLVSNMDLIGFNELRIPKTLIEQDIDSIIDLSKDKTITMLGFLKG